MRRRRAGVARGRLAMGTVAVTAAGIGTRSLRGVLTSRNGGAPIWLSIGSDTIAGVKRSDIATGCQSVARGARTLGVSCR